MIISLILTRKQNSVSLRSWVSAPNNREFDYPEGTFLFAGMSTYFMGSWWLTV